MLSFRNGTAAVLACLTACGSGGDGSGSPGTGTARFGRIALLGHEPADAAVQVPLDAELTLRFDAAMVLDCFADEDTWLRAAGSTTDLDGTFRLDEGGQAVVFTPAAPLLPETDYVFSVSPLTCDREGRILEVAHSFSFRTLDETPPAVLGASVANGATGQSRTAPLVVTASEALAAASVTPTSVRLLDVFNRDHPCTRVLDGAVLTVTPMVDLPGDRQFRLLLGPSVTDRAGNGLPAVWSVSFRTAADTAAPAVLWSWPGDGSTGVSPAVQPVFGFSESMDPATVEPSSLVFQDEFGSLVAFAVHASPDQRTLRVRPLGALKPDRRYLLAFLVSAAAVTDVSGNALDTTMVLSFTTGTDAAPPALVTARPAAGETRVSPNAMPVLTFDEPLDPAWIDGTTVLLERDGESVAAVVDRPAAQAVRVTPVLPLLPSGVYSVRLRGGHEGVRDLAGNVLAADLQVPFTASDDGTLPGALLQPGDGATGVPPAARVSVVFDGPLDPATVSAATCELRDDNGAPVAATVGLGGAGRVVTIVPAAPLQGGLYYRTFVRGGPDGVREVSGNWLGDDLRARFRTGFGGDATPPGVTATLNGIHAQRLAGVVVPPTGFTIDVTANDPEYSLDMGSVSVELSGPGAAPGPVALFADAAVGFRTFRTGVPASAALAAGDWTLVVRVADLSGNVGTSAPVPFTVTAPSAGLLPFERTQVVWARTDLDRDHNGRADFDDDLLRLGLATEGDPAGTNARARRLLLDAILAQANALFGRGPRGEPLDADSVAIRLTPHEPIALGHQQIALGGLDPEAPRGRTYGDPSSGVLGRAFYDYRNSQINDRNIGTSPGLGVFPAEMWLYQAEIHIQVYPGFQTMFAQRFLPLCPDMGGTPAGSHPEDAAVLGAGFDPATANTEQRARWNVLMAAIDDWALVIGTVLAHEIGHAVGLTAPGNAPAGLFGDASLHNAGAGAAEVMAPSVGYEAMVTLTYTFRDLNLAYLRHRILVR